RLVALDGYAQLTSFFCQMYFKSRWLAVNLVAGGCFRNRAIPPDHEDFHVVGAVGHTVGDEKPPLPKFERRLIAQIQGESEGEYRSDTLRRSRRAYCDHGITWWHDGSTEGGCVLVFL